MADNTQVNITDTTANPAPLGLLGFGMTTVLLNLHNAGYFGLTSSSDRGEPGSASRQTARTLRTSEGRAVARIYCSGQALPPPSAFRSPLLGDVR